ncbi:hypothetical protein TCAL_02191, partial [Tigriopus californicus]
LRTCDINQEPNVNLERMSSFEQFCGGPIWDVNATWNTNDPDFTNCFHKTALSWTPCFLLFIIVPFEVSKYVKSVNRNIPWNLFNLAKLIVTLALVVISIVELVLLFVKTPVVYTVDYVTSSIFIVTYLCSLVMLLLSMRFGIHTSPAQFLFYFLHTITGGITLRSLIKRQYEVEEYGDDPGTIDRLCITFGIQYSCVILLLILNLFSDTKPLVYDEDLAALTKPCPQIRASYFSKLFCGGPIWDVNATWNTNDPDFTNCFHKTALSWTPCFLLFIIVPFEVSKYVKSVNRNIPWNLFNLAKLIVTLALVVISIVELVLLFVKTPVVYTVDYVTSSIFIVTYLCSLRTTVKKAQAKGKKFSVYPALFYTFGPSFLWGTAIKTVNDVLAMAAPQIMSLMIAYVSALTPEPPWKGYFYAAALLIVTVLQSVLLSQSNEMMFVLGMNLRTALISVIYRKSLRLSGAAKKESTVGEIVNLMSVDVQRFMDLMPYLNMLWSAPLQIALCCYFIYQELGAAMFAGLAVMVIGIPFNVVVASFSRKYQLEQMKNKDDRVKLMNEILGGVKVLKLYGWERSFMGQILDIRDREIVVLKKAAKKERLTWSGASPQIMSLMIAFVSTEESKFAWKGYFYGTVLLIVTMFQSIILSQYFEKMFVVGMNLRTALISVIYRKSLRLSGAAKKESTVGEIVNLMSVDVQRFMDLLPYLNMLWSAPLQIALSCYFIYQELGVAMFSGLAVMIIAIPFNAVVVSFSRKYQLEQMKNKDDRVKLMNEILGGVKVLKLYGWEQSFMGQILDIRDREIVVLKKSAWLGAMINFVWISVPFLVALASFATYIFMDGGQVLDPSKAFVTLTYLNIMRMPMSVLPFMIIGLVQVGVSLDRINKFMNNEELDSNAVQHDESQKDHPVSVQNGTFAWGKSEPTVLRNINIKIPKGTLTAVVGTVGSGKSSLISALLGEMEKEEGTVNMVGSVAYVPQQAWMQNATLKNNILFGKELNGKKYAHIVDSCALKSDIQILPGGDTTEIGEKGINLSGGQKQRVSLARAC